MERNGGLLRICNEYKNVTRTENDLFEGKVSSAIRKFQNTVFHILFTLSRIRSIKLKAESYETIFIAKKRSRTTHGDKSAR